MKQGMTTSLVAAALLFGLAQFAPCAHSSNATLHGTVTDPSGAVIPRASVSVSAGHFVQNVSTDEIGRYSISDLPPGRYQVQIHSAGFSRFQKSGFVVTPGHETEADAQLEISEPRQEITVTAAP